MAETDPHTAARDADLFASRTGEDLTCLCLWLQVAPQVRRLLHVGELNVRFTDGFEARDVGAVIDALPGSGEPPQDSTRESLLLDRVSP